MPETANPLMQLIRRSLADPAVKECADRELLRRFLEARDTGAFEAILFRHGPMVLDVCRSVLSNEADVEDAFQATFLVLARAAASVRKSGSLAAWLHGVARRTALKARMGAARRATAPVVPEQGAVDPDDLSWREVRQVLHEELDALPDHIRGPLVLCYLEGLTHDRAAKRLGLSKGTLRRRLEQGRALLRDRLTWRGLGAALVLAVAWPAAATAEVRREVATALVEAACGTGGVARGVTALVEEVLKTMYLTKLKVAGVALLISVTLLVASAAAYAALGRGEHPELGGREPAPRAGGVPEGREPGPTWKARGTLEAHKDEIVCLAFGSDRLATADKGGSVKVWDTATGEKRSLTYPVEKGLMEAMAFTADGTNLVVAFGDRLAVWTAAERAIDPENANPTALPLPATLAVDGVWVLRRDREKQWTWEQRSELPRPSASALLVEPVFASRALMRRAADTVVALGAGGATLAVGNSDGTLTLWDVRTRKELATCKGHTSDVLAAEFSPDGKTLASASKDGTVRLWNAATGKELAVFKGHDGPVRAVVFSPDGKTLASGGDDKTVAVWDAKTAKRLAVLKGHTGAVLTVAFSRDGKLLGSAGRDKTVRLWEPKGAERPDAKDREPARPPLGPPQPELETRIEQYERAFRLQTALGNSKPIKALVTLEKVTIEKARSGETRSISAVLQTRATGNTGGKPLRFDNLVVSDGAKITDNGKAVRFADLKPPSVVRIELEPRAGTFVVVGIETVGPAK